MTEPSTRRLLEAMSRMRNELAEIRGLCPEGVSAVDYIVQLRAENKDLRELHGVESYKASAYPAGWGGE